MCFNNTIVKHDKIILSQTHFRKARKLAHSEAHPGQNGLTWGLGCHFFIKNLEKKLLSMWIVVLTAKCLQRRFIDTQSNPTNYLMDVGKRLLQIYLDHYSVRIILWSFKTSHPITLQLNLLNQPMQSHSNNNDYSCTWRCIWHIWKSDLTKKWQWTPV